MAYFPAHCDNNCKGCEMNTGGWCGWRDRATSDYADWEEFRRPLTATTKYTLDELYDRGPSALDAITTKKK